MFVCVSSTEFFRLFSSFRIFRFIEIFRFFEFCRFSNFQTFEHLLCNQAIDFFLINVNRARFEALKIINFKSNQLCCHFTFSHSFFFFTDH